MNNSKEYSTLSWFYDKYWTVDAPDLFAEVISEALMPHVVSGSEILDLCCGTGHMSEMLSYDFKVTGLDNSEGMLSIARQNAPKAKFILGDARNFEFDNKFDIVVSLFDSVNHMMTIEEVIMMFSSVKRALKKNGIFFFDINDEDTFSEIPLNGFTIVEEDNTCILKPTYDSKTKIATYKTTMFKVAESDSNLWEKSTSTVYERYYSDDDMIRCITEAEFSTIQILEGFEDLGLEALKGRRFFLVN